MGNTKQSTPGERLEELREQRGLGAREASRLSEGAFSHVYLRAIEKGEASWGRVSREVLQGIARAYNMKLTDLIDYVDGRGDVHATDELVTGKQIPVYEMVGAGDGLEGGEVIDYVQIPLDRRGEYAAYRIDGDSMTPVIPSGSTVIVKVTSSASVGDEVVLYEPEHGMMCKLVTRIEPDGTMVLGSHNPAFAPIYTRDATIMGVVDEVRTRRR